MVKSNIVTIGEEFGGNVPKILRIYEKNTGVKVDGKFKFINAMWLIDEKEEKLKRSYQVYENAILKDEDLKIFCFANKEAFEAFDVDGVLKERAFIVDKIEKEDYSMDIYELWTYVSKSYKVNNEGEKKVVLVDTANGKEYLMGEHEPRRIFIKETDMTVEFGIYPVKTKSVKEFKKVKVSELVQSKLDGINKNPNWLAGEMKIAQSSLYGKLDRDSFNAYDLIKIAKIFNITFEELTEMIEI